MQYFEITNTKALMAALLAGNAGAFRDFELSSAQITTFMTYTLDGVLHSRYYQEETMPDARAQETESMGGIPYTPRPSQNSQADENGANAQNTRLTPWTLAAPMVRTLIKGKNKPLMMKLVLRLDDDHAARLAARAGSAWAVSDIRGLFLNIQVEPEKTSCTTGVSLAVFSTDKSLEHMWDDSVRKFLERITEVSG